MKDYEIKMAESIWPKKFFKTEAEWLEYVNKWFPRLPSLVAILDSSKSN
jgi:hypothetical protein